MPQIKTYESQRETAGAVQVQNAGSSGSDLLAHSKRQFGEALGNIGGAVVKAAEQSELSDLHAQMSEAHAQYTQEFHKRLQDGTLNTEEFMQDFSDYTDQIAENVGTRAGQNYFEQAQAQLSSHFLESAAAGQAELAGVKAKQNFIQASNSAASALLNDPSSFDLTLQMQNQAVDNAVSTGGLPANLSDKLKNEGATDLAKSAVRGWIKLNPELAKGQLNEGKWDKYVDGDLKYQLLGQADQEIRGREVEGQRLKRQEADALAAAQTATQNDFLTKMTDNSLSPKDILNSNLDPFGSGSKEQFLQLLKIQAKEATEKIKTDPSTFITLWDKIHLPDTDPNRMVDENQLNQYLGRGLTVSDISTLRGEIQGKKTVDGGIEAELKKGVTEIAKGMLTKSNPLTGIRDPSGDEQYQKFMTNFLNTYNAEKQKGKTAQQLLNPDSPDYLGRSIRQYTRSNKQIMSDLVRASRNTTPVAEGTTAPSPAPSVAPRQPGESASEYLKRIGK